METKQGAICTLTWTEDITLNNVESFRQALERLLAEQADQLIVNMEAVNYINSAGLGMIADSVMAARAQQKELVVAGVTGSLAEIFHIVKFSSFIKLFATEKDAIDYFSGE
ncbi:anti-anti-sigma factor [Geobacillus subterraneus]|uniref:Anti-sigma factor antagonist n=2 Tax=Geobacillus TaxID=129337 RepID=A0ABN4NIU9_9BACL|nr:MULTISPECIES: STAS domain-containing protein [Geobacillus]AMX84637.1 anti-anti-sigma factor [Geobacillus subterraneus]KZS24839.1 anti-anti-sigma factor [Geobacillus subterraneus]OXB85459.1 anti-anti-sigma factor [Geobacillus uzenensis]QIZ66540.1 STAS domain-containing protein [Geobacillus subterraneus]WPZ18755.1 STAS domain-containing protein [Geobacillus subterraneus]